MDAVVAERAIADYYRDNPGIAAVYLFGSVAKRTAGAESDVDIGVLYRTAPAPRLMAQPFGDEAGLTERLGRPVQVIAMNQAPADLVHRILRDGILVVEHDRSHRIAFEVRARNEYFDLLPVLHQYRKRATP